MSENIENFSAPSLRTGKPSFPPKLLRSGEELSNLIHRIGHEIGNPLTAIIAVSSLLQRLSESSSPSSTTELSKLPRYVDSIISEAWRVSALNDRLVLLLSEKEILGSSCDLKSAIKTALAKIQTRKQFNLNEVEIDLNFPDQDTNVLIDSYQLNSLLIELIQNAVRSSANNQQSTTNQIRITLTPDQEFIHTSITSFSSRSCSIDLNTIFDPFVTEYAETKALGLGLTVAWSIVDRFAGKISVEEIWEDNLYCFTTNFILPKATNNI